MTSLHDRLWQSRKSLLAGRVIPGVDQPLLHAGTVQALTTGSLELGLHRFDHVRLYTWIEKPPVVEQPQPAVSEEENVIDAAAQRATSETPAPVNDGAEAKADGDDLGASAMPRVVAATAEAAAPMVSDLITTDESSIGPVVAPDAAGDAEKGPDEAVAAEQAAVRQATVQESAEPDTDATIEDPNMVEPKPLDRRIFMKLETSSHRYLDLPKAGILSRATRSGELHCSIVVRSKGGRHATLKLLFRSPRLTLLETALDAHFDGVLPEQAGALNAASSLELYDPDNVVMEPKKADPTFRTPARSHVDRASASASNHVRKRGSVVFDEDDDNDATPRRALAGSPGDVKTPRRKKDPSDSTAARKRKPKNTIDNTPARTPASDGAFSTPAPKFIKRESSVATEDAFTTPAPAGPAATSVGVSSSTPITAPATGASGVGGVGGGSGGGSNRRVHVIPDGWACELCHRSNTVMRRKGPSGMNMACNSCGMKWAKQQKTIADALAKGIKIQDLKLGSVVAKPRKKDEEGEPASVGGAAGAVSASNDTPAGTGADAGAETVEISGVAAGAGLVEAKCDGVPSAINTAARATATSMAPLDAAAANDVSRAAMGVLASTALTTNASPETPIKRPAVIVAQGGPLAAVVDADGDTSMTEVSSAPPIAIRPLVQTVPPPTIATMAGTAANDADATETEATETDSTEPEAAT